MNKNLILYLGSGGMLGVFSAGVLTKVQEMNIYDRIQAVYACSAGIFNGSYFLTRQMQIGSSIYYDDLTHGFIETKNVFYGALQRIWNGYIMPIEHNKIANVMQIDRLINVARTDKALDVSKLKNQPIPLYAKLLNTETFDIEYKDIRFEPFDYLQYGIQAVPYYFPTPRNTAYIDAAVKEPLGLEYLLERYPNSKIIAIFNLSAQRNISHHIKNIVEGIVANSMYKGILSNCFIKREASIRKDLKLARENERVLLIHPPNDSIQSWTTDKHALKAFYASGKHAINGIMDFIQ